jgi:hypothetical protein
MANAKLSTPIKSPASAPVADVLAELDGESAVFDMLRLLAIALPPRERTWWSCLAGRDLLENPATDKPPAPLAAAEAWVFKPSEENREAARLAMEGADADDDTSLCALTVALCDGKLGTGDLAEYDAPPGGPEIAAFGINMAALSHRSDNFEAHGQLLIDRAIDIARGGSGRIKAGAPDSGDQSSERS